MWQPMIGIDLAHTEAVAESIERFGRRYLERVYTALEIDECGEGPARPARLAGRFAAKEAVIKLLRPIESPLDFRSVELRSEASGAPNVVLTGECERLAIHAGIDHIAISISHEGAYAIAAAMAVGRCHKPLPSAGARRRWR